MKGRMMTPGVFKNRYMKSNLFKKEISKENLEPLEVLSKTLVEFDEFSTDTKKMLNYCLLKLPARVERTIRLRFFYGMTHFEIGVKLGVTSKRIWQLEKKGLRLMSETLQKQFNVVKSNI